MRAGTHDLQRGVGDTSDVDLELRPGLPEDAAACGEICYRAFATIAARHGYPGDFPSSEAATALAASMLSHPGFYSVVAESGGRVVGSNFLDERTTIAGVGPITVDPEVQDRGVGKALMQAVMERAAESGFAGVRLLQAAYHTRSFALYSKLGFEVREPVACLQGRPPRLALSGYRVRPAAGEDAAACDALCRAVHGHDRAGELSDAIAEGSARVVERDGVISGYTTGVAFFGHSVGRSDEDLEALIADAAALGGPGILVPARRSVLLGWCLGQGLRVVQLLTLMSTGRYSEPAGAFMPSILY